MENYDKNGSFRIEIELENGKFDLNLLKIKFQSFFQAWLPCFQNSFELLIIGI